MELLIISLIILIFLSGLFSGIETAFMSVHMIKIRSLLRQKKRGAESLHRIKKKPHKLLITILIGNNLVNISAASIATLVFTEAFGSSGVGIATGIMTFLILIFGEITPKTIAVQNAEKISLIAARPVEILSFILSPIVIILEIISKATSRLFGVTEDQQVSEEELRTIVSMGAEEGVLDKESAKMMYNLLEFEGTKVTEIMTIKSDIVMIDGDKSIRESIKTVGSSEFSRFPVYLGNKNNVIGILDIDNIMRYIKNKKMSIKIKNIIKPAYFVPESKEIDDLLSEFEGKEIPMAVVVDEYGKVSGLVSVEDILEEIVGDIFDKSKDVESYVKRIDENIIRVDGTAPLDRINKFLHLGIKKRHSDTIGGFIIHKLKRIPHKGETIKLKRAIIEVEKVSQNRIERVKIISKVKF